MAISAANIALPPPPPPSPYSISKFPVVFSLCREGKKRKKGKENRTIKFTSRRRGIGGIGVDLSAVFLFLSCIAMEYCRSPKRGMKEGREGEEKGREKRYFFIFGYVNFISLDWLYILFRINFKIKCLSSFICWMNFKL